MWRQMYVTVDFVVMNASVFFSVEVSSHFVWHSLLAQGEILVLFCVYNSKYAVFDSIRRNNVLRILCLAHFRIC